MCHVFSVDEPICARVPILGNLINACIIFTDVEQVDFGKIAFPIFGFYFLQMITGNTDVLSMLNYLYTSISSQFIIKHVISTGR